MCVICTTDDDLVNSHLRVLHLACTLHSICVRMWMLKDKPNRKEPNHQTNCAVRSKHKIGFNWVLSELADKMRIGFSNALVKYTYLFALFWFVCLYGICAPLCVCVCSHILWLGLATDYVTHMWALFQQ